MAAKRMDRLRLAEFVAWRRCAHEGFGIVF